MRVRAASLCAKEDSIAFSSTAKPGNRLPCRVIEKFPREQFEAFAGLLEFRRRSETSRQFYSEYDSRNAPFTMLSTMEQQELIEKIKRLPQDRVAEVETFVDSLARRDHSRNRMSLHQALTIYAAGHAGTDADLDPDLEAAATDHLLTA